MKTKRHLAIKKAKDNFRKKHLPTLSIVRVDELDVCNMNLKSNINTLIKMASLLTVWSENSEFQVQIELRQYEGSDKWEVEYCYPIGDTMIDTTAPQKKLNEQWRRRESYDEYVEFVKENKERMIQYILEECKETKEKLVIV